MATLGQIMVKYTMRDQEKLGFAFINPELGQTIADKFQFKLVLIDHDDPCFAEKSNRCIWKMTGIPR